MKRNCILLIIILLVFIILSCKLPFGLAPQEDEPVPAESPPPAPAIHEDDTNEVSEPASAIPLPGDLVQPGDLVYLGAFRLPGESGGSSWGYSGHGLTYYPGGDPGGPDDGFPGSLFGAGHDQQQYVSEISIPEPIISKNPEDLNTAITLQEFQDISGGMISEDLDLPRIGLEYLPPIGSQTTGKLHFCYGQHFQGFEPSHGWSELDLSDPQPAGPWVFDGYTNYATNDYLFEIPEGWADAYAPGMRLATGRFREGVWCGRGPALFAYGPWNDGNPPEPHIVLTSLTPLLLYGIQEPDLPDIVSDPAMEMNGYLEADHWWGGAWLTAGDKSGVIFVGTKAVGSSWYGFANGVEWPYDCAEADTPPCPEPPEWPYDDRGYWAEDFKAQIIFYSPSDLAAVAQGQMETYEPQPYASLDIDQSMIDPEIDVARYKRDIVGAAAFDRAHGLLYIFERLADEDKSFIHVWRVGPG